MNKIEELLRINKLILKIAKKDLEEPKNPLYSSLLQDYYQQEESIYDSISVVELKEIEKIWQKKYHFTFELPFLEELQTHRNLPFEVLRTYHGLLHLHRFFKMQKLSNWNRLEMNMVKNTKYAIEIKEASNEFIQLELELFAQNHQQPLDFYLLYNEQNPSKRNVALNEESYSFLLWENEMLSLLKRKQNWELFTKMYHFFSVNSKVRMDYILAEWEHEIAKDETLGVEYLELLMENNFIKTNSFTIDEFLEMEKKRQTLYFLQKEKWEIFEKWLRNPNVDKNKIYQELRQKEQETLNLVCQMHPTKIKKFQDFINGQIEEKMLVPLNNVVMTSQIINPKNLNDIDTKLDFIEQSVRNYVNHTQFSFFKLNHQDFFKQMDEIIENNYMLELQKNIETKPEKENQNLFYMTYFLTQRSLISNLIYKSPKYEKLRMTFGEDQELYQQLVEYYLLILQKIWAQTDKTNELEINSVNCYAKAIAHILKKNDQILFLEDFQVLKRMR